MKLNKYLLLPTALLVSVLSLSAQTEYASNMENPKDNGLYLSENRWLARSFTTGDNAEGYELDHLSVHADNPATPDANFSLFLASDTAGTPGSSLKTFSPGPGYQWVPDSNLSLAASTTYWITLSSTSAFLGPGTNYSWRFSSLSTLETLVDGWTIGTSVESENLGATWIDDTNNYLFAVTATPIPEPSTYAAIFGALALLGTICLRRRR